MDFLDEKLEEYVTSHTKPESELLQELSRETWLKVLNPRMLAGHLQGKVITMFSQMIQPKVVLEIGTYTGYSAICWAEGIAEGGKIITIEKNEELEDFAKEYFIKSGKSHVIQQIIGDATEIIPQLNETFDVVFIDADKTNYINYYHLVFDKVKSGGFILVDNVLWSGKVLAPNEHKDDDTQAIIAFNQLIVNDNRVDNVLFPIRDGIQVIRKK
jgi:caffeoyl-CoA O-methyltransferase